ncbi:MAG: hypothetical protein RR461_05830 [Angelakisella sp.]
MSATTPEQQLRSVILEQFRSVRAFCNLYGLPYSTVDNIFKRGVNSVSISTAAQLCSGLGLDLSAFGKGIIAMAETEADADSDEAIMLQNYRRLDNHGKDLVELVAAKELERCQAEGQAKVLQPSFGEEGWRQYLGAPIACRGGGVIAATEEDARQMERIYNGLLGGAKHKTDREGE